MSKKIGFFSAFSLSLLFVSLGTPGFLGSDLVFADSYVTINIRSGQNEFAALNMRLAEEGHEVAFLKDRSGNFESDHSFVQLYPKENQDNPRVVNRKVAMAFPSSVNPDSLMEGLLKIRAAQNFGASQVTVFQPSPHSPLQSNPEFNFESPIISFEELVATAGADFIQYDEKPRPLIASKPKKNPVTQEGFWIGSSSHHQLLSEVAARLGQKPHTFDDIKLNPNLLMGRKIYWIAANLPPINSHFFRTIGEIRWMTQNGAAVHLITPYLPYARSDKPDYTVGETTQGRLAADLLESAGIQGLTVVRAHAPQSLGFFTVHTQELTARSTIISYLKSHQIDCIVSPDAGFQKDATKYQHELSQAYQPHKEICLTVMNKERDSKGVEKVLGGTGVEKIRGKNIVIIDDETSSGGTLGQVAKVLSEYEPKSIFAVVTHLAGNAKKGLDSPFISKLVATNTVPIRPELEGNSKIEILSIAAEISESIGNAESNRYSNKMLLESAKSVPSSPVIQKPGMKVDERKEKTSQSSFSIRGLLRGLGY